MAYSEDEKTIIWLSSFDFITYHKLTNLLTLVEKPSDLFNNLSSYKSSIIKILNEENYNNLKYANTLDFLSTYITGLEKSEIKIVTKFSKTYPSGLNEVFEPPYILYCKGDINLLKSNSVAIVGTRQPTNYGKLITAQFSHVLSESGLTIVSGLAYGVDTVAHEACLEVDGKTIAVLGGGFNTIYPAANTNLADKISKYGLLVTEYKPSFPASYYTFPIRNRIIAGLSKGVLITEAGEKSGALHTKEYANDAGRSVWVVPGNINSKMSFGTNRLIKTCQELMVTSPDDILDELNISNKHIPQKKNYTLSIEETMIIKQLDDGEKSFEELSESIQIDTKKLNSCLTSLQIRGIIKKLPGNMFSC